MRNISAALRAYTGVGDLAHITLQTRSRQSITIRNGSTDIHEVIAVLSGRDYPLDKLEQYLPQNPYILNIGAHIGTFDLYTNQVFPRATVCSIEPNPDNFELLTANLRQNDINNATIQAAISDKNTPLHFALGDEMNEGRISNSKTPNTISVTSMSLKKTLKQLSWKRHDLLKLDCEGCEYALLEQEDAIKKFTVIIMEYHEYAKNKNFTNIRTRLSQYNFSQIYRKNMPYLNTGIVAFINNSKIQSK